MTRPDQANIKFGCRICNRYFSKEADQLNHFKEHEKLIEGGKQEASGKQKPSNSKLKPSDPGKDTQSAMQCCQGDWGHAGFIFGRFFSGFWDSAPHLDHLDNVTDDPGYSRLLADFSSVGGNVILTVRFLEQKGFLGFLRG